MQTPSQDDGRPRGPPNTKASNRDTVFPEILAHRVIHFLKIHQDLNMEPQGSQIVGGFKSGNFGATD
jgi:hypothetical protein